MRLITSKGPYFRDNIFELRAAKGEEGEILVKKYFAMDPEKVERLFRKVCKRKGKDPLNCPKEPLFPQLYFKWKIIMKKVNMEDGKVKTEKYKQQLPVKLFIKQCSNPDSPDDCTMEELKGAEDDSKKAPIFIQSLTKKGNELVKSYNELPLSEYNLVHTRVCSKDGLCIPKRFTEIQDESYSVYKLNTLHKPKPGKPDELEEVKEYAPLRIFKRDCLNETKECFMIRMKPDDGPIGDFKQPIYYFVILLRKGRTVDDKEIEERYGGSFMSPFTLA
jgi:hypothetical protein